HLVYCLVTDLSDFSNFSFFFQAEDGIRDDLVTGVQTCALPIWPCEVRVLLCMPWVQRSLLEEFDSAGFDCGPSEDDPLFRPSRRSEERRVGKECRDRWSAQ